jgi:hypothetical protein
MRRRWQTWATVLGLVWGLGTVQAQGMNKCTAPDGKVTYQDDSCSTGKAEKANIPHYQPPPPPGAIASPAATTPVASASSTKTKPKGIPEDAVVHIGPRGGRYIILPSGKKRYLPKE